MVVGLELGLKECKLWNEFGRPIADEYRGADADVADVGDVIKIGGFSLDSHSSGGKLGTIMPKKKKSTHKDHDQ